MYLGCRSIAVSTMAMQDIRIEIPKTLFTQTLSGQ